MKTLKPKLMKMFNFHTIILLIIIIILSILRTHTIEGKLQESHKHHSHINKHHYDGGGDDDDDVKSRQQHHQKHGHRNHHHFHQQQHQQHQQHHQHHQHYQHQQHQQYSATPILEFTTSSSLSMYSDNEFLIKQHEQQQHQQQHKDEIYYETKDLKSFSSSSSSSSVSSPSLYSALSASSTTSKPSLSIHLMKPNDHNIQVARLNSTAMKSETLSNSILEHTQQNQHYNRLIPVPSPPLSTRHGNGIEVPIDTDSNRRNSVANIYSDPYENSKSNLATEDNLTKQKIHEEQQYEPQQQQQQHQQKHKPNHKPEYVDEEQQQHHRHQHNYEDYYGDDNDDDDDTADDDDEYNDNDDVDDNSDKGSIDGISYDDNNNLSDRSYARITRSKLDDDYADDEPYRNGINELQMQRDAAPGVLTEQKYLEVGNEKAVQQARERYIQEQKRPRTPHELATEHWHRMIQATKCRKPLPRVIPISNNTSKRYEPYATILHRCGDDTGCCGSTASVCTVKRHEIVMVYVFSYDFNYRKEIEALPMQNHTECHCVNRGSLLHDSMPRDKRSGGGGGSHAADNYLHHFHRQDRRQPQHRQSHSYSQFQSQAKSQSQSQTHSQLQLHHQEQLENILDCQCPRHFSVFEEDVERHVHLPRPHSVFIRKCRCDCLVNNQTCLRFKHGEEGFSLEDRKCILERSCKPPVCSYGDYNVRIGRCPSYRSHLLQMT